MGWEPKLWFKFHQQLISTGASNLHPNQGKTESFLKKEICSWCWGQLVSCSPRVLLKGAHNVHVFSTILHSIFITIFHKVSPPVTKIPQTEKNLKSQVGGQHLQATRTLASEPLPFPAVIISTPIFVSFSLRVSWALKTMSRISLCHHWQAFCFLYMQGTDTYFLLKWENYRLALLEYMGQHSRQETNK